MTNKVTEEQISEILGQAKFEEVVMHEKMYVMACKLPNGFIIVESSGCVDVANFDKEIGRSIAYKKIVEKVWELEGYLLQNQMEETK